MERMSLTAFFPAYNDQHTIENIVRTAAEEMRKVTDDFEVLVVDDGSKDQTGVILDRPGFLSCASFTIPGIWAMARHSSLVSPTPGRT